jgi:hypothetical protein
MMVSRLFLNVGHLLGLMAVGHQIENKRDRFPFKGPFFPVSFFNLDAESLASDFSFARFDSEHLAEPQWVWKKDKPTVARQEKNIKQQNYSESTTSIENIKVEEFGNKVFDVRSMDAPKDKFINYTTSDEFLDADKDRSKNITHIGNTESIKIDVNNKTKDDILINTIEDNITVDDDQVLPFLGEIDENPEAGE